MSCGINVHVEVKIKNSWHHLSTPFIRSDYQLFSIMAGVRGDEEPIVKPKGLPRDVTNLTLKHFNSKICDWHHASWFNYDEIKELKSILDKTNGLMNSIFMDSFGYVFGYSITSDETLKDYFDIDDVRFVFWFDN